jgi:hypothetical protein
MNWKNALIYGSFAAGAFLFVTGRRPAGLVVAGIGAATLASQYPDKLEELWRRMPEYVDRSGKLIDTAATLLERLGQPRSGSEGYRNVPVASGNRY